jgi:hypothetical protein
MGDLGGRCLAPFTGAVSAVRQARMFHPEGLVYTAEVTARGGAADLERLGERLAGSALVRLSSAWWRNGKEWPDVLGMALRLQGLRDVDPASISAATQDLLLATVRFPWTTPFAPLGTNVKSFLFNHFHGVSPFEVEGVGKVKLRARAPRLRNGGGLSRVEHLFRAVSRGQAHWTLEVRRLSQPALARRWEPVATVRLQAPVDVDQAELRFSPFRAGLSIVPTGFVHHLRIAAYAASQRARERARLLPH